MPALLTNTSILLDTIWASSSTESLLLRSACGARSTLNGVTVNGVKMKATLVKKFYSNQRIVWVVFAPKAAGTFAAGHESAAESQRMTLALR
jgi:hypothetical protein